MTRKDGRIAVIGSNMVDLVTYVARMPVAARPSKRRASKWAMAAKAPTRRSPPPSSAHRSMMVTKVGDDMFADNTIRNLASFGVDTDYVTRVAGRSSGVAPIIVEPSGENRS